MFVKGREAAFAFLPDQVLADAAIVGKVDSISGAFASTPSTTPVKRHK
jgi:hypothetical protein